MPLTVIVAVLSTSSINFSGHLVLSTKLKCRPENRPTLNTSYHFYKKKQDSNQMLLFPYPLFRNG